MTRNQAVLVVSGYNIRAVLAFCRWASAHSLRYHIIAKGDTDPIFLTDYKKHIEIVRTSPVLTVAGFTAWIKAFKSKYGYDRIVILPSTEFLNRFLIEKRAEIEDEICVVPLTSKQLYKRISDKSTFEDLCKSHGLDTPKRFTRIPEHPPFVAKPRTYLSSEGRQLIPQLIMDHQSLHKFHEEGNLQDYFFQEYVRGRSLYLLAYIQSQGNDILFSQENLMQQAQGGSIVLARASDFHQTDIAQQYVRMFHDIGFHGLIMVEVRLDDESGRCVSIEANPRLWGPIQFCVDNDIDLFGNLLRDYGFDMEQSNYSTSAISSHYFWSGGITKEAQPINYHNYSGEQFCADLPMLRPQEIYFRKDTINLFLHEAGYKGLYE